MMLGFGKTILKGAKSAILLGKNRGVCLVYCFQGKAGVDFAQKWVQYLKNSLLTPKMSLLYFPRVISGR